MADIYDLEHDLADPSSSVTEDMFRYFHTQRVLGYGTEGQARIIFNTIMQQDPNRRDTLLQSYLPVYNQNLQRRCAAQTQANQTAQAQSSDLRRRLTTATVLGATGLAAIVLSPTMEPESTQKAVYALGTFVTVASIVGAGIVYVKHLLR